MTEDLRQKMDALRAAAARLNAASDQAAKTITSLEQFLGDELSLGVAARSGSFQQFPAPTGLDDEDAGNERRVSRSYLAYGRIAGTFRLHVVHAVERETDAGTWQEIETQEVPWSSCNREVKLRSLRCLPELLEALTRNTEMMASSALKASQAVSMPGSAPASDGPIDFSLEVRRGDHWEPLHVSFSSLEEAISEAEFHFANEPKHGAAVKSFQPPAAFTTRLYRLEDIRSDLPADQQRLIVEVQPIVTGSNGGVGVYKILANAQNGSADAPRAQGIPRARRKPAPVKEV